MGNFRQPVTVHRLSVGAYSKGVYTEGTDSDITIQASIQPTGSNDVQMLPEGRRNSKSFRLYTDTALRMVTDANPDKVTLFDEEYEVVHGEPWRNNVINHYKYIVVKIGEP